jgi:asparagine synthase (glutamine-hydrolysing)
MANASASAVSSRPTGSRLYTGLMTRLATFRLSNLARSVKKQKLTYLSDAKLLRLENALSDAQRTDGIFVEFGVALGGSAILAAHAAATARRRFVGFDTFGLIPPPTSDKDDSKSKKRYEVIASGKASGIGGDRYYGYRDDLYNDVIRAFLRNGLAVDGRMISLVKGLFEDTVPATDLGRIAFCHVDCDWYDPVKFCLNQIAPRLAPQGLILLDDYHDYAGCAQATHEFLSAHPDFTLWDGPNVIVRRTNHSRPS